MVANTRDSCAGSGGACARIWPEWASEEIGASVLQLAPSQHRQAGEAVDPAEIGRAQAGAAQPGRERRRVPGKMEGEAAELLTLRRLELGTTAPLRPLETGHQRGELGRVADEQRRPDDALDVARAAGRNAHGLAFRKVSIGQQAAMS